MSTIRFTAQNTLFVGNAITQYDMSIVAGNVRLNVDPFVTGQLNHIVQYQVIPANANIALSLVTDQNSNAYLSTNNPGQLIVT